MEEYLAVIKMFAGTFAPKGYQFCQGQMLSIPQNSALFSLLGTTYGGNGIQNFGLPDLRGRVPVGTGPAVGFVQPVVLGEAEGVVNRTLTVTNLPAHNHGINVSEAKPTEATPVGNLLTVSPTVGSGPNATQLKSYAPVPAQGTTLKQMAPTTQAGLGQPFSILQPYLGMNYIITTEGIFPPRP